MLPKLPDAFKNFVSADTRLSGSLPADMTSVVVIDLSYNYLRGELSTVSFGPALRDLNLESNEISGTLHRLMFAQSTHLQSVIFWFDSLHN